MNRDQLKKLEKDLWAAADKLRANSDLKASEYSTPVLGLMPCRRSKARASSSRAKDHWAPSTMSSRTTGRTTPRSQDQGALSRAVQRKIAAIRSACDDLIANNQGRIVLLESMAEEIYREWFVRMRFPGHQGVSKEKGLPLGWHLKPFAQVVEINPAEQPAKDDEHPFVAMDELHRLDVFQHEGPPQGQLRFALQGL